MPSNKILQDKQALVAKLKEQLDASTAGVVVDYKGISVANDTRLRRELREAGVSYAVVKNTMLRLAVDGTDLAAMEDVLSGNTAVAIAGEDPMAPARILDKFAVESKGAFVIKRGYMDGRVLSAEEVTALAHIPGREQLLSMLCSALQGNIRGLAVALNAIAEKAPVAAD